MVDFHDFLSNFKKLHFRKKITDFENRFKSRFNANVNAF